MRVEFKLLPIPCRQTKGRKSSYHVEVISFVAPKFSDTKTRKSTEADRKKYKKEYAKFLEETKKDNGDD